MNNLLIISCSKTKHYLNDVAAIDLYDGQTYRVIKKRSSKPSDLDLEILIISAKYGLIRSTDIISYYDQIMTVSRAADMEDAVTDGIRNVVLGENPTRIFIGMGFPYSMAISKDFIHYLNENYNLQIASGSIGKRLHQLKEWLESLE